VRVCVSLPFSYHMHLYCVLYLRFSLFDFQTIYLVAVTCLSICIRVCDINIHVHLLSFMCYIFLDQCVSIISAHVLLCKYVFYLCFIWYFTSIQSVCVMYFERFLRPHVHMMQCIAFAYLCSYYM
jgi:hypothetical protein